MDYAAMSADETAVLLKRYKAHESDLAELVAAKRMYEDSTAPRAPEPPAIVEDAVTVAAFEALEEGRKAGRGALANDVAAYLTKHVAFPSPEAADAVALWAFHTHALPAAESTPRLTLVSPEKRTGKTRTLEVLETIVSSPIHVVNMSVAALFRAIDADHPTLLFDEADTYFGPRAARHHEELRGLVNAGHRRGAVAYRVEAKGNEMGLRAFPAFAAVALAGIGDLPDTIVDRSILIPMRRRAPDEIVEPFRLRRARPEGQALRERLEAWSSDSIPLLVGADPEMPVGLVDRAADVWEPLIAIGDLLGGSWPARARRAALQLSGQQNAAALSLGVHLLGDIRSVFTELALDKLGTEDMLRALCALVESPWGDLRGEPLGARELARRLRPYEVRPIKFRDGEKTMQGYKRADFVDVWNRYLT